MYDILGLGIVTIDDLFYVDRFPEPDTKIQVRRRERRCGGLTGNALLAAARLGSRCAYAGALGDDELSRFARECLTSAGIDLSPLNPARRSAPIHSTIIVDESSGARTIFYHLPESLEFGGEWPPASVLRACRVLFIDHYDAERTIRSARIARAAGIPRVADFERSDGPRFDELLSLADHLIISESFARELTGLVTPAESVRVLHATGRRVTIVTCGERGCWYAGEGQPEPKRQPAFSLPARDTTACGDVFHGAYASALARGEPLAERVLFASAAAALKATGFGIEETLVDRQYVHSFAHGLKIE
jgi:sugar/nucleoside kinase (ribokinase family)